ncbi:conserved hypothetical protein [Aspergillus terreus NIH2624]|uniref:UspA domain-containing protein n=1 Tax=Aspergillus terreus (strain NIH 2624 / FGSC A1156) TaxID=341663 RepID=Q0CYD5_ASPTN|nr:uncharacterized protein ATEG_01299 [Aspergillus terreus NIH2624]EAU38056.1 conserved hypothetical protein [Aspergillus terreus NIH2624]
MPSYTRIPSLSTALEQERLELLQEVQEKRKSKKPSPPRSKGDQNNHHHHIHSPSVAPSPGDLPPRHGSIAGIGVGVTPPSGRNDEPEPSSSPSTPLRATTTAVAPPPLPKPKTTTSGPPEPAARRASDQSSDTSRPAEQRPRPSIRWDASVSMSPSATGHGGHRRSLQVQEKSANRTMPGKNAMAAVMSGLDLSFNLPSFSRGRDSGRSSTRRGNSLDSRFSAPRFARSSSPKHRVVSQTPRNPAPSAMKPVVSEKPKPTEKTETESIDKDATPVPQTDAPDAPDSAVKLPTEEDQRLEKDKYDSENNPIESSEEEEDSSSSDDESPPDVTRGRSQTADRSSTDTTSELDTATSVSQPDLEDKSDSASDKSDFVHSSKLGPIPKKPDVHPQTSFDSHSATNTPFGSEDEAELSDIKRAQKLGMQMSAIDNSVQNRSIRTIVRGDYTNLPEYTDSGRRRRRKYMVATDLSEESVYALEWTIGTILRDGDTMFAVCAIYDESASSATQNGDGAKAMQDVAAVVGSQTEETTLKPNNDSGTNLPRAILGRLGTGTDSKPGSVDSRGMSKTESERVRAVESISQTCVRLLRKTLLQVRVAVEVIHCKSPKHMITEAIDGLDPTLVIVVCSWVRSQTTW